MEIVYLDFDGVLHPHEVHWHPKRGPYLRAEAYLAAHRLFEHAELLQDLLSPYPDVRIVLSTRWVFRYGFRGTARRLPEGLRSRCIGATFHSAMDKVEFDDIPRGLQVLADVGRRRPSTWLAIDDSTEGWPLLAGDHVVITDPVLGLASPRVLAKLSLKLMRFS